MKLQITKGSAQAINTKRSFFSQVNLNDAAPPKLLAARAT
jgi:hypothetical protein